MDVDHAGADHRDESAEAIQSVRWNAVATRVGEEPRAVVGARRLHPLAKEDVAHRGMQLGIRNEHRTGFVGVTCAPNDPAAVDVQCGEMNTVALEVLQEVSMSSLVRTTALAALLPLLAMPLARAGAQSQSGTPASTPAPAPAPPPAPPAVVAGIPVNYDETKVGTYTLPDPLVASKGARVKDAAAWTRVRRPEIYRMIESTQFGRAPGKPDNVVVDRFDAGTPALDGKAIRRQTTLSFTAGRKGPKAEVLSYVPADAKGPVPLLLQISFSPNANVIDDPGIRPGEMWNRDHQRVPAPTTGPFSRADIRPFLQNGIGFATLYYGDIEPDFDGGIPFG